MIEYTVVEESSSQKLVETVSALIGLGWIPLGGVSAQWGQWDDGEWNNRFAQALTRTSPPVEKFR